MEQINREGKKCNNRPVKLPDITVSGVISYRMNAKWVLSTVGLVDIPKQGVNMLAKENANSLILCTKEAKIAEKHKDIYLYMY